MDNKVLHKFYLFVLIVEITMITVVQYSFNTEKVKKKKDIWWKGVFMNSIISITESCTDSLYDWQNNHIIMIRGDMR